MKHAFDRLVQYLQKNYFSYWIVLGIDTFIALVCTWVSFIGIHYISGECTDKGCLHSNCHLVSSASDRNAQ